MRTLNRLSLASFLVVLPLANSKGRIGASRISDCPDDGVRPMKKAAVDAVDPAYWLGFKCSKAEVFLVPKCCR